jgi:hypothetical protein
MTIKHVSAAILFMALTVSFTGCATAPKASQTALAVQAFQTKEFDTTKALAFSSTLSVFQDLGYIVQSADKDTGFITASSPAGNKTSFLEALGGVSSSGQTKATAFVEEVRSGFATVRLNFVDAKTSSSAYGQSAANDKPILDPKVYEAAFARIGDAIFVRSGTR